MRGETFHNVPSTLRFYFLYAIFVALFVAVRGRRSFVRGLMAGHSVVLVAVRKAEALFPPLHVMLA